MSQLPAITHRLSTSSAAIPVKRLTGAPLAAMLLFAGACQAQCTAVTAVPAVVSASGVYCLTANLSHASVHVPAISVAASGVVLDFQGYRLKWNGSVTSGNAAVSAQAGHSNIVIRNGLISGFTTGIETYAAGTIVEDMRMNNNDLGVLVRSGGQSSIVRRNHIRLGNGIQVEGSNTSPAPETGSVRIIDNDIFGPELVQGVSNANGIFIQSKNAFVVGNRLGRLYSGIWFDLLRQASGKYRDNITVNVTLPYTGGNDVGNND